MVFKTITGSEQCVQSRATETGDDKTANMTFNVKTVTPKELEQIDVSTIDLLYLSGSKSPSFQMI